MNRRSLRCTAALVALVALTGCFRVHYRTDLPGGGPIRTESASFFIVGLIGEKTVNLEALCPQGVSRWENQASFLDMVLSVITLWIYTPRTIIVECAGGSAYRAVEHPELGMTEVETVSSEPVVSREVAP